MKLQVPFHKMMNLESINFFRKLGRRHLRRGHAVLARVPVGASARDAQARPQHPLPDVAQRSERRRVHHLPRQRRLQVNLCFESIFHLSRFLITAGLVKLQLTYIFLNFLLLIYLHAKVYLKKAQREPSVFSF
jgi:hypothetical protein